MEIVHALVGVYNGKEVASRNDSEHQLAELFGSGVTYYQFYEIVNHMQINRAELMRGKPVKDMVWVDNMSAPHAGLTRILHMKQDGELILVNTTDFKGNPYCADNVDDALDRVDKLSAAAGGLDLLAILRSFYKEYPAEADIKEEALSELDAYLAGHGVV